VTIVVILEFQAQRSSRSLKSDGQSKSADRSRTRDAAPIVPAFHARGGHCYFERPTERGERLNNLRALRVIADGRIPAKILVAGIKGAEIIYGNSHSRSVQPVERFVGALVVADR
jgi:hypothetical protein